MSEKTDRFFNLGTPITLKESKKSTDSVAEVVYLKELNLRSIQVLSKDLLKIVYSLQEFTSQKKEANSAEIAAYLISLPELVDGIERVLAQSIDRPFEYVDSLGFTDQIKLIEAFFVVNDLNEIKELFSRLLKKLNLQKETEEQKENE